MMTLDRRGEGRGPGDPAGRRRAGALAALHRTRPGPSAGTASCPPPRWAATSRPSCRSSEAGGVGGTIMASRSRKGVQPGARPVAQASRGRRPARGQGRESRGQEGGAGGAKDLRPLDRGPPQAEPLDPVQLPSPRVGAAGQRAPSGDRTASISATVPTLRCRMT